MERSTMRKDCGGELKSVAFCCRCIFLVVAVIIMMLDQITKYAARDNLEFGQSQYVMRFWNWSLNYNQGAAFSFLANEANWSKIVFAVVAIVVAVGLIYYILNRCYTFMAGLALSFILGGAVGNLIDRIIFGKVTDFIDWHYGIHHWPTFNVADSFITVGVTLLIIGSIFGDKTE